MSSTAPAKSSTCCGRSEDGCICAKEATCSCGKKAALHCDCEHAEIENVIEGAKCSCRECPVSNVLATANLLVILCHYQSDLHTADPYSQRGLLTKAYQRSVRLESARADVKSKRTSPSPGRYALAVRRVLAVRHVLAERNVTVGIQGVSILYSGSLTST